MTSIPAIQNGWKTWFPFERKKFIVSTLLGLAGFFSGFYAIHFSNPPFAITIVWGYFLPFLAGLAYGGRYGFVAGLFGMGGLIPFFLWPGNGWACLVYSLVLIGWYTWQGYFEGLRRKKAAFWNHALVIYLPYMLAYILVVRTLFPIAFSFNPPFWNSGAELFMPTAVLDGIITKEIVLIFVCLALDVYFLKIPFLRRFFGLEVKPEERYNSWIVLWSFFGSLLGWYMFVIFNRIFIDQTFPQNLFRFDDPHEVIALVVCLSIGFLIGIVLTLFSETWMRSQDDFRLLAENSTDMISRHDLQGNYLYASPSCLSLLGYDPEEMTGHPAFGFIHPDDWALVGQSLASILENPVVSTVIFRARRKTGDYIWLETTSRAVVDGLSGQVQEIHAASRNITSRKRAEAERQVLLEIMQGAVVTHDLRDLLKTIHQAIAKVIYARNFFVLTQNQETGLFEEMYSVDEFDPSGMPPSALEKSLSAYVFRTGQPFLCTHENFEALLARGEVQLVGVNSPSWVGVPLKTANQTIGVMVVQDYSTLNRYGQDDVDILTSVAGQVALVLERKRAEDAQKESEERFALLFQNLNSSFMLHEMIFDESGNPHDYRFLAVNPAAEKIIGRRASEMIGKTTLQLFPETESYWIEKFGEVALTGVPSEYENYSRELNKYFDMRIYSPKKGQFALLGMDITERRLAEEARRQSEARYRLIAENTADVIWVMDVETQLFKYVSPSVQKLRGYTPEEVMSQPVSQALTPQSLQLTQRRLAETIPQFLGNPSGAQAFTNEVDQPHKDGRIIHTEVTTTFVINEQGKLEIVGVTRDITERKKIEKTLYFLAQREWVEHGEYFFNALARYLAETLAVDYVLIDRVLPQGETARTLANYRKGEIHPNFEYELKNTPCATIYSGQVCTYVSRLQQTFPLDYGLVEMGAESYSGIPLMDSRGNRVGLIATLHHQPIQNVPLVESILKIVADHAGHEIERMEAEAALRNERDRAQNYLDTVEAILIVLDKRGYIALINRKGCRLLGYPETEMIGKNWFESCLPAPLGVEQIYPIYLQMMSGEVGIMEYYENAILTRSGEIRHIAWHNTVLRDEQGNISGALSAGEDITERKRAEEALRLLNEQLEQRIAERTAQFESANKELESFSYSVSHDLRAPLRAIDGFCRIIQDEQADSLTSETMEMLDTVRANAQRMGILIDDLLKFSRLGRQTLVLQPVDPTPMVHNAFSILKLEQQGRHLEIIIHPLATCRADASLLAQVWVNLISNALKYTRKRENARIEIGNLTGENGETVYYVKDNGVGFDMRYINKLFGVFQRLHSDNDFEGTGVGLAIVQRIITRHGGRIWAESEPERGTTFYFTLENG